jgi:hypothetical protein
MPNQQKPHNQECLLKEYELNNSEGKETHYSMTDTLKIWYSISALFWIILSIFNTIQDFVKLP